MTTSSLILSDRAKAIDKSKTNRLTKRAFISGYLSGFSQGTFKPHYSDRFIFNEPAVASSYGKDAYFWEITRGGAV